MFGRYSIRNRTLDFVLFLKVNMFGNDSLPSCIYSYDVINSKNIHINELKYCEDTIYQLNKYRNELIEIKRKNIDEFAQERLRLYPEYASRESEIEQLNKKITAIYDEIKLENQRNKVRSSGTNEQKINVQKLTIERRKLRDEHKKQKEDINKDVRLQKFNEDANKSKFLQKRKEYSKLIHCDSRGAIEQTVPKKGYPKFKRCDGSGKLTWQFKKGSVLIKLNKTDKKKTEVPLTWDVAVSGEYTCLQIKNQIKNVPQYVNGKFVGNKQKEHMIAVLPMQTQQKTIEVPFYMHRPLPPGSVIKQCYLTRKKIGYFFEWKIQFVISRKEGFDKPVGKQGHFSVDINWTKSEEGFLVAVCRSGETEKKYEELVLSNKIKNSFNKAKDLQSICKDNFNEIKKQLIKWFDFESGAYGINLPEWLTQDVKTFSKWESSSRLFRLAKKWTINRFDGDNEIFSQLQKWMKRESHLFNWQVCLVKKTLAFREHLYKTFIAKMRTNYCGVYIEDIDGNKIKKLPEATDNLVPAVRKNRDLVAPFRFLELLQENFKKVYKLNPAYTSKRCNNCKVVSSLDSEQHYNCTNCGAEWNRHRNAADNLFDDGEIERLGGKNKIKHKKTLSAV